MKILKIFLHLFAGFAYDILSDLPDDVMLSSEGNENAMTNGTDILSGLEPFDGNVNSANDASHILQNGPTSLTASHGKGGPGNVVSVNNQMNSSKVVLSPRGNLTNFSQNRPPQGPISTSGMATPATPMLNSGSVRGANGPMGNMQTPTPLSSSVNTSMIDTSSSYSNGPIQNSMLQNMPSTNTMFSGAPMSMAYSMTNAGQNNPMMSMGQTFSPNQSFPNNMSMMPNNRLYNNNPGFRMGMPNPKMPNIQGNFNPINPLMVNPLNTMGMQDNQDPLMMSSGIPGSLPMQRMVSFFKKIGQLSHLSN